jgi:beta-galactosidase/beta-glucuronidase
MGVRLMIAQKPAHSYGLLQGTAAEAITLSVVQLMFAHASGTWLKHNLAAVVEVMTSCYWSLKCAAQGSYWVARREHHDGFIVLLMARNFHYYGRCRTSALVNAFVCRALLITR